MKVRLLDGTRLWADVTELNSLISTQAYDVVKLVNLIGTII